MASLSTESSSAACDPDAPIKTFDPEGSHRGTCGGVSVRGVFRSICLWRVRWLSVEVGSGTSYVSGGRPACVRSDGLCRVLEALVQPSGRSKPWEGPSAVLSSEGIQRGNKGVPVARERSATALQTDHKAGEDALPRMMAGDKVRMSTRQAVLFPRQSRLRATCL